MTEIVPPNGTPDLCYTMDYYAPNWVIEHAMMIVSPLLRRSESFSKICLMEQIPWRKALLLLDELSVYFRCNITQRYLLPFH